MLSRAILKCLKCRATAVSRPQYFATRQMFVKRCYFRFGSNHVVSAIRSEHRLSI